MSQFAPKRIFDDHPSNGGKLVRRRSFSTNGSHDYEDECVVENGRFNSLSPTPSPSVPVSPLRGDDSPDSPLSPTIIFRAHSYDEALFDIRKVSPEKIAAQLTLIDLPLFKAIQMEELSDCNWTKKDKLTIAPNIVAFTKRFNHTSFWVVREILNEDHPRARAEVVTQFIKISKKLFDLNNIHSLKAVLSGLQSGPIFRLAQTWKLVHKKDRGTFERLQVFLCSEENWKNLRSHLDAANLPCIPHLGLYLTDLSFINTLQSRANKEDAIRNIIVYFQSSTYEFLTLEIPIQKYLLHRRYIDELQKFFEDDNYKLSLQCEPDPVTLRKHRSVTTKDATPPTQQLRTSKSHEDLLSPFSKSAMDSLAAADTGPWTPQPHHKQLAVAQSASVTTIKVTLDASPKTSKKNSTLPSHFRGVSFSGAEAMKRAVQSHNHRFQSTPSEKTMDLLTPTECPAHGGSLAEGGKGGGSASPYKIRFLRGHKKAHSLGSNVLSMFGISRHGHSNNSPTNSSGGASPSGSPHQSHSLLDDSCLDDAFGSPTPSGSLGNLSVSSASSDNSDGEEDQLYKKLEDIDDLEVDYLQATLIMEGPLKRKVLKRQGKTVSQLRGRSKAWVQLTDSSLLLLPSKPKRKNSRPVRIKGMILKDWGLKYREAADKTNDKQFILFNDEGNQMKFTAKSASIAQTWVDRIRRVAHMQNEREKLEAEQSLIKL